MWFCFKAVGRFQHTLMVPRYPVEIIKFLLQLYFGFMVMHKVYVCYICIFIKRGKKDSFEISDDPWTGFIFLLYFPLLFLGGWWINYLISLSKEWIRKIVSPPMYRVGELSHTDFSIINDNVWPLALKSFHMPSSFL